MSRAVYDLSMLAGATLASAGVYVCAGLGPSLIVAGALVILQTQLAVRLAR